MTFPMRTLLSVSLAAALAGCSLAPTYERPDAPVDAAYPTGPAYNAAQTAAPAGMAVADIGWRDFFGDPLLQQLIEQSLTNNRDLRVAALNVEAARAQYRIQRADLAPSIGVAGQGSAQRTPADLSPSGQATTSHSRLAGNDTIADWAQRSSASDGPAAAKLTPRPTTTCTPSTTRSTTPTWQTSKGDAPAVARILAHRPRENGACVGMGRGHGGAGEGGRHAAIVVAASTMSQPARDGRFFQCTRRSGRYRRCHEHTRDRRDRKSGKQTRHAAGAAGTRRACPGARCGACHRTVG